MGITAFPLLPLWGHTSLWYLPYSMFQGDSPMPWHFTLFRWHIQDSPGVISKQVMESESSPRPPTSGPLHGPLLPAARAQAHCPSSALSLGGLLCALMPSRGLSVFQRRVLVTCDVAPLKSPCGFNTVSSFLIKKAKLFTRTATRSWDDQAGVRSDWWRHGRSKCHRNSRVLFMCLPHR